MSNGCHNFGGYYYHYYWRTLFRAQPGETCLARIVHSFGGSAALAVSSLSQLDLNWKSNVHFSESVARAAFLFH